MLRRIALSFYTASLIVLGIAIGDSFVTRPLNASPTRICAPTKSQAFIISMQGGIDMFSVVDCSKQKGDSCDWYVVYGLYLRNIVTGQYDPIFGDTYHHSGYCNQQNSADDLDYLFSGDFYATIKVYSANDVLLASAYKYFTIP